MKKNAEVSVSNGNPFVECNNLSFSYGTFSVLKNVCLTINQNEFIAIVGPNAGGKTTLLKLILGLLEPDEGWITIDSQPASLMKRKLGYVAQHPTFARDFPITVEQLVGLGCLGKKSTILPSFLNEQDKHAVIEALDEVEALDLANRQIATLSGGQLQRVMLARALVMNPSALLLDEPTSNIDQRLEYEIFDLLQKLNERMMIAVVSHDLAFVHPYVNKVACVNGSLVCHDTDAMNNDLLRDLYGGDVSMVAHRH